MNIDMKRKIRVVTIVLMLIYMMVLAYVCFFSERYGRVVSDTHHYNLQPFREISRFYIYRELIGVKAFIINLFFNILAFVPFGFMVSILWQGRHQVIDAVFCTFLLSLVVEVIQFVFKVGSFDVDDLILNTCGGFLGVIIYQTVNVIRRKIFGKAGL